MSGAWSVYGRDTVTAGESYVMLRPKISPATPKPGVIFCHGSGSTATMAIDYPGAAKILQAVAATGHPVLAGDWGGIDTWANDTALARITTGKNYLQNSMGAKAGKIILIGVSMGGANALAWAGNNPTMTAAAVGLIPVVDFNDIKVNKRMTLDQNLDGAYGGSYSEATHGPGHNPQNLATQGKYNGLPIRTYGGLSDPACVPATQTAFAAASGAATTGLPGGHDSSTLEQIDPAEIVAFLSSVT